MNQTNFAITQQRKINGLRFRRHFLSSDRFEQQELLTIGNAWLNYSDNQINPSVEDTNLARWLLNQVSNLDKTQQHSLSKDTSLLWGELISNHLPKSRRFEEFIHMLLDKNNESENLDDNKTVSTLGLL